MIVQHASLAGVYTLDPSDTTKWKAAKFCIFFVASKQNFGRDRIRP